MTPRVAPALYDRLRANEGEFALLDVRPAGAFARGHILLASNAPLERLEIDLPRLVPRRTAPIVLCDEGDGAALRAAAMLGHFGYADPAVLEGGVGAWRAAGYQLFEGVYVPSKAFGEHIEAVCGTPTSAPTSWPTCVPPAPTSWSSTAGRSRNTGSMSIPGGIDVPGAELVHRVRDLAPDPSTLVVVNCAGRTRSIIGAQSLINAGVANRVVALENGTMGWTLAGHPAGARPDAAAAATEPGRPRLGHAGGRACRKTVRGAGDRPAPTLRRWQAEAQTRTLYLCDVRSPEEYQAGHLPGALCTPGGQLVQATDSWLATHGARVGWSTTTACARR